MRGSWPSTSAPRALSWSSLDFALEDFLFDGAYEGFDDDEYDHDYLSFHAASRARRRVRVVLELSDGALVVLLVAAVVAATGGAAAGAAVRDPEGTRRVVASAAPAQGLYFVGYDAARAALPRDYALSNFAAGCAAQLCGRIQGSQAGAASRWLRWAP